MPNPPKFFITHSWKNVEFAKRLADDLRGHGLEGFFDYYSIKPGENFPERISKGLEECDIYVPILSFVALESRWCQEEINAAIAISNEAGRNGRPVILPILIENCQDKLPVLLRSRLHINFTGRYDEALRELLQKGFEVTPGDTAHPEPGKIANDASRPAPVQTRPPNPVEPASRQKRITPWIVIALGLVVLLICGIGGSVLYQIFFPSNVPTPTSPVVRAPTNTIPISTQPIIVPTITFPIPSSVTLTPIPSRVPPTVAIVDFSGTWITNIATLNLTQQGNRVTGSYQGYGGTWNGPIDGFLVDDRTLKVSVNPVGSVTFFLNDTGKMLTSNDSANGWCGVRSGPLPSGCGFTGSFHLRTKGSTIPSGSVVELLQSGASVTGNIFLGAGKLEPVSGTISWGKGSGLAGKGGLNVGSFSWDMPKNGIFSGTSDNNPNIRWCGKRDADSQLADCGF